MTPLPLAVLAVGQFPVATYVSGEDLEPTLSPRPFLHPVRTPAGTVVTDREPADHRWHLGIGVAVQDVGGVNCWGGRTCVPGLGYVWRDDHGMVGHDRWHQLERDHLVEDLGWHAPGGERLLDERREIRVGALPGDGPPAWWLRLRFRLANATGRELSIGSPATNGTPGSGYGGFFWRLPPVISAVPFTADAEGEEAVHGSVAPWLAYAAVTAPGGPGEAGRPFTVVAAGDDRTTRRDAWFVRSEKYPGFGSSLAAERPLVLAVGDAAERGFTCLVADGRMAAGDVERLLALVPPR